MCVIGQCNRADFSAIEHLADITEKPEAFDTSTITQRQRLAFAFLTVALRAGISWYLIRSAVKEVLFWGEGDEKVKKVTIKFVQKPESRNAVETFRRLWIKGDMNC